MFGKIFKVLLVVLFTTPLYAKDVTFIWDANTEENLAGYKIYYGKTSRYEPSLVVDIPALIKKNCSLPDEGELTESQKECKTSWEVYCTCNEWNTYPTDCKTTPDRPDPYCDYDFYSYDGVVDVKNVTTYTITGLAEDVKYFTATAYDTDGKESKFSREADQVPPNGVVDLREVPEPEKK